MYIRTVGKAKPQPRPDVDRSRPCPHVWHAKRGETVGITHCPQEWRLRQLVRADGHQATIAEIQFLEAGAGRHGRTDGCECLAPSPATPSERAIISVPLGLLLIYSRHSGGSQAAMEEWPGTLLLRHTYRTYSG